MPQPSPEQWARIEALLDALLDLPPDQHAAYLDAHATDADLRREVEALLAQRTDASGWLESSVEGFAPPLIAALKDDVDAEGKGVEVGPYRIVEEIGRGGMGTVYRAERADGAFAQTVALKLIRRGFERDDLLRRFHAERQILATLDHPNIARLLDGGLSPDGRPYFVMEYVAGQPLTNYADAQRLPVRERLRLFRQVCAAVQYAHQRLVVHRDLKPSNILVTPSGQVKLLDFGIAKLLDEEAPAGEPLTRTDQRLLTPEYAAPEQISGGPIQTQTDVYQLGVVLYELLTGRRPYRLKARVQHEIERAILEAPPTRPSTALTDAADTATISAARSTSVERLRRELAGELDQVVLMALRKEPARRYESAAQFSEDVGRYLDARPVQARRDTLRYRARKFVQRNRAAVALGSLVLLLVAGLAVVSTVAAFTQARQQAALADERDRAEAAATYLASVFEQANPFETDLDTLTVAALLDQGVAQLHTDLADRPRLYTRMAILYAGIFDRMGRYDRAAALLARADSLERTHPDPARRLEWQQARGNLALNQLDYEAAMAHYRAGLPLAEALGDARARSVLYNTLGIAAAGLDDYAAALVYYDSALVVQGDRPIAEVGERVPILLNMAILTADAGRTDTTRVLLDEVARLFETTYPVENLVRANTMATWGGVWARLERYDEAEPLLRDALRLQRRILGEQHYDIAVSLANLAHILNNKPIPDFAEAAAHYQQAIAILTERLGPDNEEVGANYSNLGTVYQAEGRLADAVAAYEAALRLNEQSGDAFGEAITQVNLCGLLRMQERYRAARTACDRAEALFTEIAGADFPATRITQARRAAVVAATDPAAALPDLRTARQHLTDTFGPDHWRTGLATLFLGDALGRLGQPEEAEPLLLAGYAAAEAHYARVPFMRQWYAGFVADFYERQGDPDAAQRYRP